MFPSLSWSVSMCPCHMKNKLWRPSMKEQILVLYPDRNRDVIYQMHFTSCTIVAVLQQLDKYHPPPSDTCKMKCHSVLLVQRWKTTFNLPSNKPYSLAPKFCYLNSLLRQVAGPHKYLNQKHSCTDDLPFLLPLSTGCQHPTSTVLHFSFKSLPYHLDNTIPNSPTVVLSQI